MNSKILMLILGAAIASNAAMIKEVKLDCKSSKCGLTFQFTNADDLPSFYQKYDASARTLTLGFSDTKLAMGEGTYEVNDASQYIRSMRVFEDVYRGMAFLKVEMSVGPAITGDKNEISMNKADFTMKVSGAKEKGWTLSKLFASKKKAAEKALREEKKAAQKAALEEKKRLAEEKKAAEKQALLDKKAAAKAALEEKKRIAEEEKRLAEEQKKLDKAIKEGGSISALLQGLKEMTVLISSGMEQFRLASATPISINMVSNPDKSGLIVVSLNGPQKSPMFKIGSSSLVKSVSWEANGLQIQLQPGAKPVMVVQEGALILQAPESSMNKDGFVYWSARPDGIYMRHWVKAAETKPSFDKFVKNYEPGSKKIVSASQTFHLRPVIRELIVVTDETEFRTAPNEKSQVVKRLVFGDRLVSLDMNGLYRKVQVDNRIGYVNRRDVSFFDELSSVQAERLKQVDKERGEALTEGEVQSGSMLESLYEDRIIYSSFGRRDPFVEIKGLVEDGINIDQVELVGIIWEADVPLAILVDTKNPSVSYTLKEGDKILNGKVLKITQTDVLFLIQEFGVSRRYSMGLPDKFGGQK